MATQLQLRKGTTTEHNTFVGANGEVTVDTYKDVLVVHDGVTAGGFPVAARANTNGTISLIKKDGTSAGTINALGLFNDTLTSINTNQALTAAQGKVLKDSLNTVTYSSFGNGQTWQDVTASRALNTTYTNNTGKPIQVNVRSASGNNQSVSGTVNGVLIVSSQTSSAYGIIVAISFIVPNGQTYSVGGTFSLWTELR